MLRASCFDIITDNDPDCQRILSSSAKSRTSPYLIEAGGVLSNSNLSKAEKCSALQAILQKPHTMLDFLPPVKIWRKVDPSVNWWSRSAPNGACGIICCNQAILRHKAYVASMKATPTDFIEIDKSLDVGNRNLSNKLASDELMRNVLLPAVENIDKQLMIWTNQENDQENDFKINALKSFRENELEAMLSWVENACGHEDGKDPFLPKSSWFDSNFLKWMFVENNVVNMSIFRWCKYPVNPDSPSTHYGVLTSSSNDSCFSNSLSADFEYWKLCIECPNYFA